MKQSNEGSAEDVKSQSQVNFSQKHKHSLQSISITNKQILEGSLRNSYQLIKDQSQKSLCSIGRKINTGSYFLEAIWNQIIPSFFKGNNVIQISENTSEFYKILKQKGHIVEQGSIQYSFNICKRKKTCFIIAVYDNQQNLFSLADPIYQKIKNYMMVPIQKQKTKELNLLTISPKQAIKVALYLCRFNFAGELMIFCQIDGNSNQEDFNLWISIAQFSVNDYLEFQQICLNKFKNEGINQGAQDQNINI